MRSVIAGVLAALSIAAGLVVVSGITHHQPSVVHKMVPAQPPAGGVNAN